MTLDEMFVVILCDTLEGDTQKVGLCLEDTLCDGETRSMVIPRYLLSATTQTIVGKDRVGVGILVAHDVHYLDMTTKAHHLITNGVLES